MVSLYWCLGKSDCKLMLVENTCFGFSLTLSFNQFISKVSTVKMCLSRRSNLYPCSINFCLISEQQNLKVSIVEHVRFTLYKPLCIVCCFWCKCQEKGYSIVISCIQTWWNCALYSTRLKILLPAFCYLFIWISSYLNFLDTKAFLI